MRSVLIVGGAGYIGTVLTGYLLERGYRVRCLDNLLYGHGEAVGAFSLNPDYEFIQGDLREPMASLALAGIDDVVILAGLVGDPICAKYPQEHQSINVHGLGRFIESLNGRGLDRVIFASTCSNYGELPSDVLATEATPLRPLSAYARAKVAREANILFGRKDYNAVVLRFATAFGLSPRMRFDLTISEFTRTLCAGELLEIYDADSWRPYVHVHDIARAIELVLAVPARDVAGEIFNVGGDANNRTKRQVRQEIDSLVFGTRAQFVEGRSPDRRNYRVSFEKIKSRLGFVAGRTVESGIRELIAALKAGQFKDYEARKSFYRNQEIRTRSEPQAEQTNCGDALTGTLADPR